jgi:hypothetical protein
MPAIKCGHHHPPRIDSGKWAIDSKSERGFTAISNFFVHCDMLQLALTREGGNLLNDGPFTIPEEEALLNSFSSLHLITSMFLVDARNQATGGLCSTILKKRRRLHLLDEIRDLLHRGVGQTTVGDFLRKSRNKLATHGDFSFGSLPPSEREVLAVELYRNQLATAVGELPAAVTRFRKACTTLLPGPA